MVDVAAAQRVEQVAAQLAHHLAQAVQIGRQLHRQLLRRGQGPAGDDRQRAARLGILLLRVVDEAGMVDVRMIAQPLLRLGEQVAGAVDQLLGLVELLAMDGADGVGRAAKRLPAEGERLLSRLMLVDEDGAYALHDRLELLADVAHCSYFVQSL